MPITDLQLITVTGKYLLLDGTPAVGSVTFTSSVVITNTAANEIVFPKAFTATLNASGQFSIQIPATNDPDLTPSGFTYSVSEQINGSAVRSYAISLPYDLAGATVDLADIAPAVAVDAVTSYVLRSTFDAHLAAADPHAGYRLESVPIAAADVAADVATQAELDATTTLARYECIVVAVGDETTAITATGNPKVTFRMPYAMTLTAVRASLTTASSSGIPTVDINEGGTSILSTKLTIDANEKTSTTAATAAVISDTALADDAEITIDIDVAGTGAAGLKVYLIGTRV